MGVPGSGKGTQAQKLIKRFGCGHISTGDLLRALENNPDADPKDKKMLQDMKSGGLVADTLIYKLAFEEIEKNLQKGNVVILDGAIRTVEQAKKYQEFFKEKGLENEILVLEFAITDDLAYKRAMTRRKYAEMGKLVPSVSASVDAATATVPKPRHDDDPEIFKERIEKQGNKALQPILSYYEELGVLIRLDASGGIDEVDDHVMELLEA